jgi:hypothetical protein
VAKANAKKTGKNNMDSQESLIFALYLEAPSDPTSTAWQAASRTYNLVQHAGFSCLDRDDRQNQPPEQFSQGGLFHVRTSAAD